jgi:hypothetical protein
MPSLVDSLHERDIEGVDVVEWSRALDVRLSEWCCSVSMVWVEIPSREEQQFDSVHAFFFNFKFPKQLF